MQFQQRLVGLQEHMMSFAIKLTANRDDALDLLQDTMQIQLRSATSQCVLHEKTTAGLPSGRGA